MVRRRHLLFAALLATQACAPDLDDRTFLVDEPRILAIQADPPEAAPGTEISYRLLWAQGIEEGGTPSLEWSHCNLRKPLAELGPIHPGCLLRKPEPEDRLGSGFAVVGTIPQQACRRFGPDIPEPTADEPAGRPVDPDPTGGFYQPVIVHVEANGKKSWSMGATRLSCGIAGATPSQLSEMARSYVRNTNPSLTMVRMRRDTEWETLHPLDPPSNANRVSPGETVAIQASWPACEEAPCEGAEPYVVFDPMTRTIRSAQETIRVSWFSTGGYFEEDRTGASSSAATSSGNTWTAPEAPGRNRIWVVLRDERGGVGWQEFIVTIVPPGG